jgi:hemoglobin
MKMINGVVIAMLLTMLPLLGGCATPKAKEQSKDFFTSGDKEADQRASQRMARAQQLSGQSGSDQAATPARQKMASTNPTAAQAVSKSVQAKNDAAKSLYDRLGGDAGIKLIVEDFTPRALADPRVNWQRKGVKYGGFSVHHNRSEQWNDSPDAVAKLKDHMIQFLALATGGPTKYEGKEMAGAHAKLHITNAEFDASLGDLKATLDKLEIPNREQKELLAVVESTRAQIVTER